MTAPSVTNAVGEGAEDGRRRQFLELAMNASNQLLGVINALLDLNGIASGRLVRVLAVLSEQPNEFLPGIPTLVLH